MLLVFRSLCGRKTDEYSKKDIEGRFHMAAALAQQEKSPDTQNLKKARVLFVDDSASDVAYVETTLKQTSVKYDYEFEAVPSLIDALSVLHDKKYDLILLDLNLLDISGTVPVSALHTEAPDVPILVYSGTSDWLWRDKAMKTGATGYLVKGLDEGFSLGKSIEKVLTANKH
jgi:PleD family two-component response regulator